MKQWGVKHCHLLFPCNIEIRGFPAKPPLDRGFPEFIYIYMIYICTQSTMYRLAESWITNGIVCIFYLCIGIMADLAVILHSLKEQARGLWGFHAIPECQEELELRDFTGRS